MPQAQPTCIVPVVLVYRRFRESDLRGVASLCFAQMLRQSRATQTQQSNEFRSHLQQPNFSLATLSQKFAPLGPKKAQPRHSSLSAGGARSHRDTKSGCESRSTGLCHQRQTPKQRQAMRKSHPVALNCLLGRASAKYLHIDFGLVIQEPRFSVACAKMPRATSTLGQSAHCVCDCRCQQATLVLQLQSIAIKWNPLRHCAGGSAHPLRDAGHGD